MSYKKWFMNVIVSVWLLMLTIVLFNYYIDPYQIYGKHKFGFIEKARYQNAGLINSYLNSNDNYDSVIIGTSMTQNFIPKDVENILKWNKVLKLSMPGASPKSQYTILNHALQTNKVKNVLWGIGDGFTTHTPEVINQSKSMPFFLYKSKYSFDAITKYLLNYDILKTSIKTIFGKIKYKDNINELGYWMYKEKEKSKHIRFNKKDNLDKIRTNLELKTQYKYKYINNLPAIDFYLIKLIKQYPDVKFIIFFSPYSTYNYSTKDNNYINMNISMRRYLVNNILGYNNISIYAFDTNKLTFDLNNYKDSKHYIGKINKLMLDYIKNDLYKLNYNNISSYEVDFINKINSNVVYSSAKE